VRLALSLLVVALVFAQARNKQASTIPHRNNSKRIARSLDSVAANDPKLSDAIGPRSTGSAVLRAQILLDRANYSSGEIDGFYGKNLRGTVGAFQKEHGLTDNGVVGPETWQFLNTDGAPVVTPYTIVEEDTAGPFEKIPEDMQAKAALPALNYESPLEALAEKFHCSPKTLEALNPGKRFDRPGETIMAPNVATAPVPQASKLIVDGATSSVTALDAGGRVLARFAASIGSAHDPLPKGTWKILGVRRQPEFHYNPALFWDSDNRDTKATIAAGPNNPVGVVWISLSKPHYGIHGTPEPSKIGYTQSHGCIRLTNWDAWKLADMVKPGTPAILTE
jgi:lipoprotein-anchoring transpeptidase ErfK/SrfK